MTMSDKVDRTLDHGDKMKYNCTGQKFNITAIFKLEFLKFLLISFFIGLKELIEGTSEELIFMLGVFLECDTGRHREII